MNKSKILIPVKGSSRRCLDKNRKLLPFTANYLKQKGLLRQATVISDSNELLEFASSLGFNVFLETRAEGQDELVSCYQFIKNETCEEFFLLPVTQPFRGEDLIRRCFSLYLEKKESIDFVTSFTEMANRERFYLDFHNDAPVFKDRNKNRKGELCNQIAMIDGALYLIKSKFIIQSALSDSPNTTFWNGNFACVKNNAPFIDIDTEADMEHFISLKKYLNDF